jgi:hypothetical protein
VINALKTDLLATHPASKNLKDDQRSFNLNELKGTYQLTNSHRERERERESYNFWKQKTHQAREKPKEESSRKFLLFFHRKEIIKQDLIEQEQATPKKKQKPTSLLQTRSPRLETSHRQALNSRTLPE